MSEDAKIIVDSSGWIEYIRNGKKAVHFAPYLENTKNLIVPSVVLFEVFKFFLKEKGETVAIEAWGLMEKARIIELDNYLNIMAAKFSVDFKMPMADSLILATAEMHDAHIYSMDHDFSGLERATVH